MKTTKALTKPFPYVLILVGAIIGTSIYYSGILPSARTEQAKESVFIVDTTVEVKSPFMLFLRYFPNFRGDLIFRNRITVTATKPSPTVTVHYGGTAFLVNGRLVTAAHVVLADVGERVVKITVQSFHGDTAEVIVVRADDKADLAELATVDPKFPLSRFATLHLASSTPANGDSVVEIGHPSLIPYVISYGTIVGYDSEQHYNIATLDTFGGNSGSPILNTRGRVIGVCHTILSGSRFTGIGTYSDLHGFLYPDSIR